MTDNGLKPLAQAIKKCLNISDLHLNFWYKIII